MSTIRNRNTTATRLPDPDFVHPEVIAPETQSQRVGRYALAVTRISMGWVFLWAFLDKAFGLGHETAHAGAWIRGGSPTKGFLAFGATGPLKDFYHSIAGATWADWLFMIGLLAIGTALILGIGMKAAAASGAALLVLMWSVTLPPANNLFMDSHLIYAMVLVALAALGTGATWGFGKVWERSHSCSTTAGSSSCTCGTEEGRDPRSGPLCMPANGQRRGTCLLRVHVPSAGLHRLSHATGTTPWINPCVITRPCRWPARVEGIASWGSLATHQPDQ